MLQKRELTGRAKMFWDAAQYIRAHGWCQGNVRDGEKVCLTGAFFDTVRRREGREWTLAELKAFAEVFIQHLQITPACWNDAPGRTKQEVIDKLEEIAWQLQDEQ